MLNNRKKNERMNQHNSDRRGFLFTAIGGVIAAVSGWVAGAFPRPTTPVKEEEVIPDSFETRISSLEAKVAQQAQDLLTAGDLQPLGKLEGEMNERVVFEKSEVTVTNPEGVLLNLVATNGHVGIRFYKDFDFGNEQVTSPWHMGFIEGLEGYQALAILRDWRFTATLWEEDGRMIVGRLDPHPPANESANGRFHVRGTLDEVQAIVEASGNQVADIFQVLGRNGASYLAVNGEGSVVVGSHGDPNSIILHDTQDGRAYSLHVTDGQLSLERI
jgi:hypothetical protein